MHRSLPEEDRADRRLPPPLRGREGFAALVDGVPLRASVAGGGAFALVRMAHAALRARRVRVHAKASAPVSLPRDAFGTMGFVRHELRRRAFEDRLRIEAKEAWPLQALVVEAGADGPAALRALHADVLRPTHVLVPSLARDPVDGSVRPDAEHAGGVARSVPPGAVLVSGERDPGLRRVLRTEAERVGARFMDAAPRDRQRLPGLEVATVCDRLLHAAVGAGLSAGERVRHMASLQRRLRWQPSARPGLAWFDGARVASPATLRGALDHLAARDPARAHAVVHVPAAGGAGLAWLAPVLSCALEDGVLAHATVAGEGAAHLAQALRQLPVSLRPRASPGEVLGEVEREGRGAVVLLGAATDPWRTALAARLCDPACPPGTWAMPAGSRRFAASAAAASPSQRGLVPLLEDVHDLRLPIVPAPSLGQRPKVHILGDPEPASPRPRPAVVPAVVRAASAV